MFDKRVIYTLIISFLICMVIGFVNKNIPTDELLKQMFVYKIHHDKTYDLLIGGDSRVYRGVSTGSFENIMELDAYNLGFSSALYEKQLFDIIDQRCHKEAVKTFIVLGITPHSLTKYSMPNGHIHQIKNMKKEDVLMYSNFLRLKSIFTPYSISDIIDHFSNDGFGNDGFIQVPYTKEGWVASDYNIRQPYSALKSYHTTFKNRKVDSIVMSQFFNQVKIWSKNGCKVYGFIPPSSPNMESLERSFSGFSDGDIVKHFIGSGGKWIALDSVYHSYDGSHLSGESAIRLSNEMAYKIKMGFVDTTYDQKKNYRYNYLPLNEPILSYFNNFDHSEYSYKSEDGQMIGKIDTATIYYNTVNINTDTIIKKKIKKIITRAQFLIPQENVNFSIVYQVKRAGENVAYQKLSSKWILKKQQWGNLTFKFNIPEDLQQGDLILCYIYNNNKEEFYLDNLETLFY